MISTEQLAAALKRLAPQSRDLLDLSLRRRLSDEALAVLYEVGEPDVARRRAAAIEALGQRLGVGSEEELRHIPEALLEESTWDQARAGAGSPSAPADGGPAGKPAARRGGLAHVAAGVLASLVVAGVGTLVLSFDDSSGSGRAGAPDQRAFAREPDARRSQAFDPSRWPGGNVTAYVKGRPVLYSRPGGGKRRVIPAKTEWESPRVLGVVRRRGEWLAVQAPELDNGEVGWIRARDARLESSPWSLHADLSRRQIDVRRNGRSVRRLNVAIGSPRNPTPKGRFSVTDKLRVTDRKSPYGCCVLALSGHQVDLPPGWPGGDRLAVHATRDVSSIGQPVSLGCMRARSEKVRWLIDTIPLGSPIFIRS